MTERETAQRGDAPAEFAAGPVRGRPRRQPVAILGWVAVLGAIVAVGMTGRVAPSDPAVAQPSSTVGAAAAAAGARQAPLRSRRFDPAYPSVIVAGASEPGPIEFEAVRSPAMIAVHGAITAPRAARILVTARSLDGDFAGSESTRLPRPATNGGATSEGPTFSVTLPMPARIGMRVLVVQASAYDTRGNLLASSSVWLEPEV